MRVNVSYSHSPANVDFKPIPKGKRRVYGNTPADDLLAAERERAAVEMANDGRTFDEIAAELGYANRGGAYKAYRRALRRIPKTSVEDMRLQDEALLRHYRKALAPNVAAHEARAVEVLLKAMEHRAKLFGLYQEPAGVTAAPIVIYEYPQGMIAAVRGELVQPAVEASYSQEPSAQGE